MFFNIWGTAKHMKNLIDSYELFFDDFLEISSIDRVDVELFEN